MLPCQKGRRVPRTYDEVPLTGEVDELARSIITKASPSVQREITIVIQICT